jgi:outer membrane protein TolC
VRLFGFEVSRRAANACSATSRLVAAGAFAAAALLIGIPVRAQTPSTPTLQLVHPQGQGAPPATITLHDALERAKKIDVTLQLALIDAEIAREDRVQAQAARFPTVSERTEYLGTQGNGTVPSGRFVTNDGVHVYRQWGVLAQDLSPNTILGTSYKRAQASEAIARAKAEIAARGLEGVVTKNYYALVTAQRRYATVQQAVQQAQRFLQVTQDQERLGQVAHVDVIKADLQYQQNKQAFDDAVLAIENARLNLAVVILPGLNENFTVVDDLDSAQALPSFPEVQAMAEKQNPDLKLANETLRQAGFDVKSAKNAFLPTLTVVPVYGIEANAFALHSSQAADPEHRVLSNLGYFITASLNIPVWDWGTLRSKLHQTQLHEQQAQLQLTQTQRQLATNVYLFYNEAIAARSAVESTRRSADLATESLRLTVLRYQAGESTAQEVVDAQNLVIQARNAYDDAETRYRLAVGALQTLTGGF